MDQFSYDQKCECIKRLLEGMSDKNHINIFNAMVKEFGEKFKYKTTNNQKIVLSNNMDDGMIARLCDIVIESHNQK